MMRKMAVIAVELVDESFAHSNGAIADKMFKWFREEAMPAPWAKEIKKIVFQKF